MRHRVDVELPERTKNQLRELARLFGTNETDVVRRAMESFHRRHKGEIRAMRKATSATTNATDADA